MITRNNALTYFTPPAADRWALNTSLSRNLLTGTICGSISSFQQATPIWLSYLNEGKGDIVAAAMTITEERRAQASFTLPYNEVDETGGRAAPKRIRLPALRTWPDARSTCAKALPFTPL